MSNFLLEKHDERKCADIDEAVENAAEEPHLEHLRN